MNLQNFRWIQVWVINTKATRWAFREFQGNRVCINRDISTINQSWKIGARSCRANYRYGNITVSCQAIKMFENIATISEQTIMWSVALQRPSVAPVDGTWNLYIRMISAAILGPIAVQTYFHIYIVHSPHTKCGFLVLLSHLVPSCCKPSLVAHIGYATPTYLTRTHIL